MLVKAVVWRESRFDPHKVGTAGERCMQHADIEIARRRRRIGGGQVFLHRAGFEALAMNHDLELIDAEHMPAYLESSNPANNPRYASVGFEPHGEFSYPGGGPVVTTMWRPAR